MKKCTSVCGLLAMLSASCLAQKAVHCSDGDHIQIDVSQIAIKYDASSIAGTLSFRTAKLTMIRMPPEVLTSTESVELILRIWRISKQPSCVRRVQIRSSGFRCHLFRGGHKANNTPDISVALRLVYRSEWVSGVFDNLAAAVDAHLCLTRVRLVCSSVCSLRHRRVHRVRDQLLSAKTGSRIG
jgi:hypothetical protein